MGWAVSKTFGRKLMDEVSDGFDIKGVVQMGDGSSPDPFTTRCFALKETVHSHTFPGQ
jgi:hypothetical protein